MPAALSRLNGPPIRTYQNTSRGAYAAMALGSLAEAVKSAVQALFFTFLAVVCLCTRSKWNRRAFDEIKGTVAYTLMIPVCLAGVLFPKTIDTLKN